MKPYGIHKKTQSSGGRVGTHPDNCICKWKRKIKKRERRNWKLNIKGKRRKE